MKKFYAIIAAALVSVSLFAAPSTLPKVADLAAKYDVANNVVLCIYFDDAPCNDVVLAGSYNEWSTDPAQCEEFEELDGFDGWWAVEVKWVEGIQAKPLQLDNNGGWAAWKYQAGDPQAWTKLSDGLEAKIENGFTGESNISYPSAGAYIYEMAYWKEHQSPCVVHKMHNYKIYLLPPPCPESEALFQPAINSPLSGEWKMEIMDKTLYKGKVAYVYEAYAAEGEKYKFVDYTFGWSNEYQWLDPETQEWKNFDDSLTPESDEDDVEVVADYSDGSKFKYPLCGIEVFDVDFVINVPAGAPAAGVELMGDFIGGENFGKGVQMEIKEGRYTATVKGVGSNQFKLRETANWDNQVQIWDAEEGKWVNNEANWKFEEEWQDSEVAGHMLIELDWSDPTEYRWTDEGPQGIQNVTLSEKAHKVVVDGVLYIVRDNKMFNVQGGQVR